MKKTVENGSFITRETSKRAQLTSALMQRITMVIQQHHQKPNVSMSALFQEIKGIPQRVPDQVIALHLHDSKTYRETSGHP
jgi:hypothetical protein